MHIVPFYDRTQLVGEDPEDGVPQPALGRLLVISIVWLFLRACAAR